MIPFFLPLGCARLLRFLRFAGVSPRQCRNPQGCGAGSAAAHSSRALRALPGRGPEEIPFGDRGRREEAASRPGPSLLVGPAEKPGGLGVSDMTEGYAAR